jgi:hypothetical protein
MEETAPPLSSDPRLVKMAMQGLPESALDRGHLRKLIGADWICTKPIWFRVGRSEGGDGTSGPPGLGPRVDLEFVCPEGMEARVIRALLHGANGKEPEPDPDSESE